MSKDNSQERQLNFLLPISVERRVANVARVSGSNLTQTKIEESRKRLLQDLKHSGLSGCD